MRIDSATALLLIGLGPLAAQAGNLLPNGVTPNPFVLSTSLELCGRAVNRAMNDNIDFNTVLRANTGTW